MTTERTCQHGVILTDRMCQKRVGKRIKIYDRKCRGLYVSIVPSGIATFNFKFSHSGKQQSLRLGDYHPELFTLADARTCVYDLRGRLGKGEDIAASGREARVQASLSVDALIDLYLTDIKRPIKKQDGSFAPKVETWESTAAHLERLVRPRLGSMAAPSVRKRDIVTLQSDLLSGAFTGLRSRKRGGSVVRARQMRKAVSGLFNFAVAQDLVDASPASGLPELPPDYPRERVLSVDEIRIFWLGLDRTDTPWPRSTRLALKFALVTMLRSTEFRRLHVDEISGLGGPHAIVTVPAARVKKRRVIVQPLSDLAQQIIQEPLAEGRRPFVFSLDGSSPIGRSEMATALRGDARKGKKRPGLCELLQLRPFTPHDLRRTAATIAGDLGCSREGISKCLDHLTIRDRHGRVTPTVTGKVYDLSERMAEKRAVLNAVAAELERIVDEPQLRAA
jgi:integrase